MFIILSHVPHSHNRVSGTLYIDKKIIFVMLLCLTHFKFGAFTGNTLYT